MKTLHIADVVNAIEDTDENRQAYYLPDTGEIVFEVNDGEKYIPLPDKEERGDYQNMELFIDQLDDPEAREWLGNAIRGKGAFRRFRGACEKFHLLNDWYDFSDQAHINLAINWCEDHGILYDMEDDQEEEPDEDVSDFYHEDFKESYKPAAQETKRNPVHVIEIHDDNLMNALYVMDGFRQEVNKQSSDFTASEETLRKYIKNGCRVLGASDHGRIVGLMIYENTSEETIIRALYVSRDQRRKGIGSMLLETLKDQDTHDIWICSPHQAGAFFQKRKFSESSYMICETLPK